MEIDIGARGIRIAVVGTKGSGKTTLAKGLAAQFGLAFIEMDALNWQTGWRDLSRTDREEFVRRVTLAIAPDAWVLDSAYGLVRDPVWRRATHLIWLDYERRVIMYRVICRSLVRAALRTELWAGNRERWSHILRPSHPIRWAWSTGDRRRKDFEERIERQDYAHLVVLRLRRPREAEQLLRQLRNAAGAEKPSALTQSTSRSSAGSGGSTSRRRSAHGA